MAERLTTPMMLLAALLIACASARAQGGLNDPTRPPMVSAETAEASAANAGSRLQSILISGSRRLAVIDGVTVPLGGKVDGATVVAIAETEVKLRRGEEVETLKLYPNIERAAVPTGTDNKEGR
jgi:MSHA biogenesis protein MshK